VVDAWTGAVPAACSAGRVAEILDEIQTGQAPRGPPEIRARGSEPALGMVVALVCGCSRVVLCSWVNPKGGWLGFACAGGEAFLWPGRVHGAGSDGDSGRGAAVAGVLAARW
jgi:hypothetical protein